MTEVLRSKVFYARARLLLIVPTFGQLPKGGPVRAILALARMVMAKRPTTTAAAAVSVLDGIMAKDQVGAAVG